MNRTDRQWCWFFSALILLLTAVPYALAFLRAGSEWVFSGFVFGVEDGNSYLAKMLAGSAGAWLFRTPYTGMQQNGTIAFLPYLLLGKLAQPPALHTKLILLFHFFRLCGIPFLIFSIYRFISLFLDSTATRRWATGLAVVGGGLGWLIPLLGQTTWLGSLPLDFYSPETFGFLSILGLPHLIFARALLLAALRQYLQAVEMPGRGLLAGALIMVVALLQPMTAMLAFAVIGAHLLALAGHAASHRSWKSWLRWVRAAVETVLLPLPLLTLLSVSFLQDPFLSAWTRQNSLESPHPLHYVLAFGALLPVAWLGAQRLLNRDEKALLPVAWSVMLPVLAYAPVTVQRRLPEGIWVALLILAGAGISRLSGRRFIRLAYILILIPSTLLLYAGSLQTAANPEAPVFHPRQLADSFAWSAEHLQEGRLVLTSYETGNILPAYAPVRVVMGHGPESIGLTALLPTVEAFYGGEMRTEACTWLNAEGIDYVFWGSQEKALGGEDVQVPDCLTASYNRDGIRIFEMINP
ncbi:MAG: hypothetical protein JXA97_05640 [Anaerolineales bacterium]|nr:hypothetical protein [Anaerolineales bacterium]